MHTVHYQRWNPSQSPVRIEFPPQLPAKLAAESGAEARGSLYGLLLGGEIRVLAARSEDSALPERGPRTGDPVKGLEKIGIFVIRNQGEVFLAESDLERFESQRAAVALVIAGSRAGFFVRQADGSIQTIRSHEEFAWAGAEAADREPIDEASTSVLPPRAATAAAAGSSERPLAPGSKAPARTPRPAGPQAPHWPRATAAFLAIPLAAVAYFRPLASTPVQLQLRQAGEAVAISWNPAASAHGGRLEILDGLNRTQVDVGPDQSSLTFAPRSGSLEVRMTAVANQGPARLETATLTLDRLVMPAERPLMSSELPAQIELLDRKASQLRELLETRHKRIDGLQKSIDRLTGR